MPHHIQISLFFRPAHLQLCLLGLPSGRNPSQADSSEGEAEKKGSPEWAGLSKRGGRRFNEISDPPRGHEPLLMKRRGPGGRKMRCDDTAHRPERDSLGRMARRPRRPTEEEKDDKKDKLMSSAAAVRGNVTPTFFLVRFSSLLMMTLWEQQTSLIRHVVHFGRPERTMPTLLSSQLRDDRLLNFAVCTQRMSIFSVVNYR